MKKNDEIERSFLKVKLARHPQRPFTLDIIDNLFDNFVEIYGDRRYAEDKSVITGFGDFANQSVFIVGQQKGKDINERRQRNFGMPKPEGYRKALRGMKLAEKFECPVISFIDTPGAYPGIDAEERGQAEAIAKNLLEMARIKVPIIVVVIGEGGSGGALAIGIGDRVLMMENAIYSVITPEGCAAILWKDSSLAPSASYSLKLTASDLVDLGVVDKVIKEPEGGAQTNYIDTYEILKDSLKEALLDLSEFSESIQIANRFKKLRGIGKWGVNLKTI